MRRIAYLAAFLGTLLVYPTGSALSAYNEIVSLTTQVTSILPGTNGGLGVNNGSFTITIAGNVTHAGAFARTITATAATNSTLPAGTHTLAGLDVAQTWAAVQTFTNSDICLLGSSSGCTTFTSANAGASNFTLTFPAATDTIVTLAATQTLTNKSISSGQITGLGTSATVNTGTSGATIPLLNGANIFGSGQVIGNGSSLAALVINGGTAGGSGAILSFKNNGSADVSVGTYNGIIGSGSNTTWMAYSSAGAYSLFGMTQTSVAQSGTVCYNTVNYALTYDATLGCLTSSARFKMDITRLTPSEALSMALRLEPVSFRKRPEDGGEVDPAIQLGFTAEQAAIVDERLIARGVDGQVRGVRYQQDSAIFAGAIQAQQDSIERLRADNDNLREEIAELRRAVSPRAR